MLFKRYWTVFDVFMVKKRLKNGQRYRFVRFKNIIDLDSLAKSLGSSMIGTEKLLVYKAHERKPDGIRNNQPGSSGRAVFGPRNGAFNHHVERDARKYNEVMAGERTYGNPDWKKNNNNFKEKVFGEQNAPAE